MQQTDFEKCVISNHSGRSHSLWMNKEVTLFTPLDKNLAADVTIVGAGVAGLTCAYTLAKAGKKVVVLDQGAIGGGQSARTSAHLSWVLDDRFYNLEKMFGEEGIKTLAESHSAAIDYIEKIIREEGIECDFVRVSGYLFLAPEDTNKTLEKELKSVKKTGLEVREIEQAPLSSFNTGTCLEFPRQAQFHILKYLQGLATAFINLGGQIFTDTHVKHMTEDAKFCETETDKGFKVTSLSTIVATCTPINDRFYIHTKQSAYRTYVIGAKIPKNTVQFGLYWDTADPYHYVRIQPVDHDYDCLLVGGEDHKTGQSDQIEEKYSDLEEWARHRFSMIEKIDYKWSGQVFEPIDSIGFIGRNPGDKKTYIVTGDSGNGLTHGTIAGLLITDLILGKENSWEKIYSPSRKTLSAASEFLIENCNSLAQLADWFTPGEHQTIHALKKDDGIILREGLKKIAVYKDKQGKIHINSALCPHLGGCLRWNNGEKSWDCPLHGSRFDGCGKVMDGPSICDLTPH